MLIGTLLFGLGSVIAAAAPGIEVLIAGIALAGAGGAMIMPASMSILTNVFTGERRGTAIGMWGAATELVSGIGVLDRRRPHRRPRLALDLHRLRADRARRSPLTTLRGAPSRAIPRRRARSTCSASASRSPP